MLASELALPNGGYRSEQRGELLLSLASLTDDADEKLKLARQAEHQLASQSPSPATLMGLENMLGEATARAGLVEQSERHARRAVELSDRLYPGASTMRARTYNGYGDMLRRAGKLAEANQAYATAESIYRSLGDQRSPAFAALTHNRGVLLRDLGDSALGLPLLEQSAALALGQFGDHDRRSGLALRHLALVRADASPDPKADIEWRRALAIAQTAAKARERYDLLLIGCQIALDLGRPGLANARLREADALDSAGALQITGSSRVRRETLHGTILSRQGDARGALEALATALHLAAPVEGRREVTVLWRVELAIAEHHERNMASAEALAHYSAALQELLRIGATEDSARVVSLRGKILGLERARQ
jgi:tetratricopeptide (TPR) repeat protein